MAAAEGPAAGPGLDERVRGQALELLQRGGGPRPLESALRLLAKYRCRLLQQAVLRRHGPTVLGGPFAGMRFVTAVTEGCYLPKLLGSYEQELHGHLAAALERGYDHVLNIGSAEGYYAVGLARRLPRARIHAYDSDPRAQRTVAALARLNGVAERLSVGGSFAGEAFERFADGHALLLCDIEGGEADLLDPERWPALRRLDIVVELHDVLRPGLSAEIVGRFRDSHDVTLVPQALCDWPLPAEPFARLGSLDRLLAVWEWRSGPTPWAVMLRRPG